MIQKNRLFYKKTPKGIFFQEKLRIFLQIFTDYQINKINKVVIPLSNK